MKCRPYPIEFCGNCGVGQRTKEDDPFSCDFYSPGQNKRCSSWTPGHFLRYERVVYICSPCNPRATGELGRRVLEQNLRNAECYCRAAVDSHAVPIAPHLLFTRFLDEFNPSDRNIGLECAIQILKQCDELWVFGDRISEGMKAEIEMAQDMNMPVIRIAKPQADEIIALYEKGEQDNG